MPFADKETGPERLSNLLQVQRCDEKGAQGWDLSEGGAPGPVLAATGLDSVGSWKLPHLCPTSFWSEGVGVGVGSPIHSL